MASNELLPYRNQKGFLNMMKTILKSIFYKQTKSVQTSEETIKQTNNSIDASFIENLKAKTDIENACKKETLEYIVDSIEKNAQTLNNLTIEQLEDVNEYYAQKIQKVDQEINKLKK